MKRYKGYISIAIVCLFYWILDSIWSYFSFELNLKKLIFSEPGSYLDTFLLRVPPYQIVSRLMVVILFAVVGILIIEFMIKRQAIERERMEAHDTFLTVLNSIDATIYVADIQTHEVLFMNRHMIDNFGGNLEGETCFEAFGKKAERCDHCVEEQLLDESGNPKGVVVWEGRNSVTGAWYVNYDRAIKWVDGRIAHLQIATDITQMKELQEKQTIAESQLRQSQKLEAIGNLAGGIAHDFNNILASIIGYTELTLIEIEKGSAVEENLQEVFKAGKRAKDLVRQILAFARQSDEEHKPIQVDTIAKEVLKFIRSSIPTTIEITSDIGSSSLIMGNATQVHQIMMNLCTNAAQAMEDNGGTLRVSLKDVVIESDASSRQLSLKPGNYIALEVSDTGTGISPENIDSIFEPYFTTKGPGEGTGMGLAMVHGIVESYGGKIEVNSTLGEETIFSLYLPVIKRRTTQRQYESDVLPQGTERILLVDDEAPLAQMGGLMLERLGYSVITRTSSIEALQLFRSRPDDFDLVITDMTMPNMTGNDLAMELIAIRPDIPIILCTGFSKKIAEEKAYQIGIRAFLYKPLVRAELAKAVRNVLNTSRRKN